MKISTSFLFDRATERMSSLQNKLATTQSQLSASKQVLSPSDSPEQAAAITRLQGQIDRQDSHSKLLKTSLNRYKAEETALRSANDLLIRLKELGVQAANDALGPSERKLVAKCRPFATNWLALETRRTTAEITFFRERE